MRSTPRDFSSPEENGKPVGDVQDPAQSRRGAQIPAILRSVRSLGDLESDAGPTSKARNRKRLARTGVERHQPPPVAPARYSGEGFDDEARPPSRSENGA